jgi:hypothetical protein
MTGAAIPQGTHFPVRHAIEQRAMTRGLHADCRVC